jgi:hypothetical protein
VAVVTTEGLTITIPRDRTIRPTPAFVLTRREVSPRDAILWVGPGDRAAAGDHPWVFITRGGRVAQTGVGGTYFIQRGGGLAHEGGHPQAVYFEPGAMVPERLKQDPIGHEARAIVPSVLGHPFVIRPGPLFGR